ncbi:MAG: thioredoxin domain-containing protein [Candidatus Paceibacterota bacterium]|jgi:protein-disulfide isomerase
MTENNLTKYEKHQLEKADREKADKSQKRQRQIWRYLLWLSAGLLIVVTVWQVNRLVSGNSKISPTATSSSLALTVKDGDWIMGATTSPVVLIEYSDFQCPACAEYNDLVEQLKKDYPDKLTVVYRHYPWFFHEHAMSAALVAEAAGQQGKFWAMHDLLFKNQNEWSAGKGSESFNKYANQYAIRLGLDQTLFTKDLANPVWRQKIEAQLAEGKSLGIDYTPAFAINGKIITNPKSYEEFRQVIDQVLKSQ